MLSYALCLLIGVALPLGLFYVAGRRAWRQLAVAEAYRVVARSLGLSVDTRGVSVHGHLDGRRLYVGEVLVGHGRDRRIEHRGLISLSRPLGLGLLIRRRSSRSWLRRRARAARVRTADEEFDQLFEVFGDDEARVRTLLDGQVQAAIIAFAHRWPDVMVTDHHVRIVAKRAEASPGDLGALVEGMRRLADLLVTRRREVPVPDALLDVAPSWEALGLDLGVAFDPWLPALHGPIDGREVQLTARREAEGFRSELIIALHPPRDLGLLLQPQTLPDGYWSVGQDIQVDEAAFDSAFVIKGYDPSAVRRLLNDEVRRGLLALVAQGLVIELEDRRLRLREGPMTRDGVEAMLRDALAVARAMGV